jgi:hypothetical protein
MAEYDHYSNLTYGTNSTSSTDTKAAVWLDRIKQAKEYKKAWSQKMKADKMEQYYMGQQWEPSGTNYEPYTINLVFSAIEIKLPTLLFTEPVYHTKPKPQGSEYDYDSAIKRALLREDMLNTAVSAYIPNFAGTIEAGVLDAFFRFAVVEVGYSADWIDNPNADKPILRSDTDNNSTFVDGKGNVIKQPLKLPAAERVYVKRIHARNFYVGGIMNGETLDSCNWCAYWEYVRVEDVKANPNLKNRDLLDYSGHRSPDFVKTEYGPEVDALCRTGDIMRMWHVFDNRKKVRLLISDPQALTHKTEPYERLPLFDLRFHKLNEGWYPLPPVSNWKSPQDEYNEAREQQRNHRKRFTRKFVYNGAAITDEEEQSKLFNGGDGTFVKVQGDTTTAIKPIDNAELGASSGIGLTVSKDDFNLISGTSSEERGEVDRTTATQANITNQKGMIRDSRGRIQIAEWLSRIGKEILLTIEEKFTMPMWVKMEVGAGDPGEALPDVQEIWHRVTSSDLEDKHGDMDISFDVNISLDSLSPVENDQDRQAFLLFISTMQQFPELSMDPELVREAAYKCGYRNAKVIRRMQAAAQLMLVQKMEQLGAAAQGASAQALGSKIGQGQIAQAQPPVQQQITNQLQNPTTQGGI